MTWRLSGLDTAFVAAIIVLAVALVIMTRKWARYRLLRREEGRGRPWRIRRVPADVLDAVFTRDPALGHGTDTEVAFISRGRVTLLGSTSDLEAWILAVLARRATIMFEFGTCTGRTTYLWARNSPANARVYTLTLAPDATDLYRRAPTDDRRDEEEAIKESVNERFLYSGTDVASKVVQLYGDSKAFDETPFAGRCDLIFVDGAHTYSYVASDSAKALRMIAPGGIILWHDYRSPSQARGVFQVLNELADRLPLVHLEGTSLVAYRA